MVSRVAGVRQPTIQPDLKAAQLHIDLITGEREAAVTVQVFPEGPGATGFPWHAHGTLRELAPRLIKAQREGCGVFIVVNETDGEGRRAHNVTALRAGFVDLDGTPLPKSFPIEPHIVTNSSPDRYHMYWLTDRDDDVSKFGALQARLASYYDGDPTVIDPPRVLRLAGFWHLKADPFTVRLTKHCPFEDAQTGRYTLRALEKRHPCEFTVPEWRDPSQRVEEPPGGFDNEADVARAIAYLKQDAPPAFEGTKGDKTTFEVACHCRDLGLSEERTLEAMSEHYNPRCEPPWGHDGLAVKVRNAYSYAKGDAGSASIEGDFDDDDDESWLDLESNKTDLVPVENRGLKVGNNQVAADTYENAVAAIVRCGLDVAWNDLKQVAVIRAELLPWDEFYGRIIDDHKLRFVRLYLHNQFQGVAYRPSRENLFEALMTCAYKNRFNPIVDWLASLEWDGVSRVERLLSRYFDCGDDAYTRAVSRCFMVAAVRRQRQPGCKFDTLPIIKGKQGCGKSSGVRVLFGDQYHSDADLGSLHDKDSVLKLRGVWGYELAEIDSLFRHDSSPLKAFLSRATDHVREPYGRVVVEMPRTNVFVATYNEGGPLKDSTGARRYWPLQVADRVDLEALARDRDQLWAEAAVLEAQGASLVLPSELWPVAAERQAAETSVDPWADLLADFLERRSAEPDPNDGLADEPMPADRVHTAELFDALGISGERQTPDKGQRLRTVMEHLLGWDHAPSAFHIGGRKARGYVRAGTVAR